MASPNQPTVSIRSEIVQVPPKGMGIVDDVTKVTISNGPDWVVVATSGWAIGDNDYTQIGHTNPDGTKTIREISPTMLSDDDKTKQANDAEDTVVAQLRIALDAYRPAVPNDFVDEKNHPMKGPAGALFKALLDSKTPGSYKILHPAHDPLKAFMDSGTGKDFINGTGDFGGVTFIPAAQPNATKVAGKQ